MSFLNELKRRNVLRVGAAYVVSSWLLIQVAETIFPLFGYGDTPARLIVIVLGIAFIPSMILAWVFEITPEGLKKDADVDRGQLTTRTAGKKLDRIILVVLAVALGYFAFDKFILDPARDAELVEETTQKVRTDVLVESYGDKSIAVLPFVNMSSDPEQEYFSDGISEELLNVLAKVPGLRVISRSSAFSFKGKDIAIPMVAEQLNVAHVLEGSVRKSGNRVRITAQLIEARSDTHLWSETFDRELDDIFAVQDEIAAIIVAMLKVELALVDGETVQPTVIKAANSGAYDAYLRGRELVYQRSNLDQAAEHLERSLRLDNNFAPAHAQLAIATLLMVDHGLLNLEDAKRVAKSQLDRADELEPNLAETYAGRALLAGFTGDPEAEIRYARKALALNPSYIDAMNWLRGGLETLGRYEESIAVLEKMQVADPLNIIGRFNYARVLSESGRIEEAHQLTDQLLVQSPRHGKIARAGAFMAEGKLAESLSWALQAGKSGWVQFMLVGEFDEARRANEGGYVTYLFEGRYEEVIRHAQENLLENPDNQHAIWPTAVALYYMGRIDESLPYYERLLELVPEGRPISNWPSHVDTLALALARRKTGDEDGAQNALQIVRQDHAVLKAISAKAPHLDLVEAMIAAFEHRPDEAVAALSSALQHGLRDSSIFDDPVFEEMLDEQRFIALEQELDALLAVEHAKVLQLICFNNPVPDDWQPLPETCEGVVEQTVL